MSDQYILAIDQGTTGSTAVLASAKDLSIIGKENVEYPQIYPKPGWVEHNLNDIYESVEKSTRALFEKVKIDPKQIIGIGITNQRETICAFDQSGKPLHHALVWQDRRTSAFCAENAESFKQKFTPKTGLPLDPYFSGTKIKYLLENVDEVKQAADSSNLRLGTIDTFLIYQLTGGESFVTDPSNASRTLLYNIQEGKWDDELVQFFSADKKFLPEIKNSFDQFGTTKNCSFLPDGIPILCVLGDQQAALFGQGGYQKGDMKITYGTGAFILQNTGEEVKVSQNGMLSTVAYGHQGKLSYALEGSTYIAGAAVQYLRDNLKIISSSPEVETLAKEVTTLSDMEELYFFPFFTGIGSPYWQADAKGCIYGLTRGTKNSHIAYACLEGMTLSVADAVNGLIKDSGIDRKTLKLKVDGGACANNLLMQMQSNFLGVTLDRPQNIETTAFGVLLGSLVTLEKNKIEEVGNLWRLDQSFSPEDNLDYYQKKYSGWNQLIKRIYL